MNENWIWGRINLDGTIAEGTGFRSSRTALGEYKVTFDTPLSSNSPTILLTGVSNAVIPSEAGCIATSVVVPDRDSFSVRLQHAQADRFLDRSFSFLTIDKIP